MKKAIIAGAASAVLAALPVVGVFADATTYGTVTDTLTVNIAAVCGMTSSNRVNTGTEQEPTWVENKTFAHTMTANDLNSNFGSTTLNVKCNIPGGYQLKADFVKLDNADTEQDINYSSTEDAAAGKNIWNAVLSGSATGIATAGKIATGSNIISTTEETPAAGSSATITYSVSTANNQAQGTYTGTATYTLTATPQGA